MPWSWLGDHWRPSSGGCGGRAGRGIGVITAQERSVFSATEFWFWFDEPGAPVTSTPESCRSRSTPPADHRGPVLLRVLGQQPGDDGGASWPGVRLQPVRRLDRLPRSATGSGHRAGGSRTTVMLAGAVEGASAKIKERPAGRRPPARDRPRRPGMADGGFRVRGDGAEEDARRDRHHAAPVQAQLPEDMEAGSTPRRCSTTRTRPCVGGPEGPGRLLPVRRPRLPCRWWRSTSRPARSRS